MCLKTIKNKEVSPEILEKRTYAHGTKNSWKHRVDMELMSLISNKHNNVVLAVGAVKEVLLPLYINLFQNVPHRIELSFDGDYLNTAADDAYTKAGRFKESSIKIGDMYFSTHDEDDDIDPENSEAYRTFKGHDIMDQYTMLNIIDNYEGSEIAVYRQDEDAIIVLGDDMHTIMYKKDNYWYALTPDMNLPQYIIDNVVTEPEDEEERYFSYVVYDNKGFDTTDLPVKQQNINLEENYNDDLPDEAIKEFIQGPESGICILFGAAGTGKTSYIRHLMHSCKNTEFMILNTSCFDAINDTSFINMIINNKDSVIILEDCEDLLVERMNGNSRIATLLNLSDGILGDALRLKFICTFNAKIGKIDSAVLRKGRTHVKYEFKPLVPAKAKALAETLNIALPPKKGNEGYTLAEIYYSENDLVEGNVSSKVGF